MHAFNIKQIEKELLKKENYIVHLKNENKYLKEILKTYIKQPQYEGKPRIIKQQIYIEYFGLFNGTLVKYLYFYNIIVNFESPDESPTFISNNPMVFNIDEAQPRVWAAIKHKKPLLVAGNDVKSIANKIINWLNSLQSY